ncbi:MAG TPA: hypothetical protein DCM86_10855, partial [Verrucomicrobiales bacterium]|nr:hypothetical protein [Verrucomicrobiales bacterium]
YGIETLNIDLGSGDDLFNVQGTSATTNLRTAAGADEIYVSSTANVSPVTGRVGFMAGNVVHFSGDDLPVLAFELATDTDGVSLVIRNDRGLLVRRINLGSQLAGTHLPVWDGTDDNGSRVAPGAYSYSLLNAAGVEVGVTSMRGTLDAIGGVLNIDAGSGTNLLMVSDAGSRTGDGSAAQPVLMTASLIRGLAPSDITYAASGTFASGITLWAGYGADYFNVVGSRPESGVAPGGGGAIRTVTTLNTGLGDDHLRVALTAGRDGFFVLNTQGPYDHDDTGVVRSDNDTVDASPSSLPLVIFGGQGKDDITGGSGSDILFGDRGRVESVDALGRVVQLLGFGGIGDITDGISHLVTTVINRDPSVGSNDYLNGGPNTPGTQDLVFGGANGGGAVRAGGFDGDTLVSTAGDDVLFGDIGRLNLVDGVVAFAETRETTLGGADAIDAGNGDNLVFGGLGGDRIATGSGRDLVVGDYGNATYLGRVLALIQSTDPTVGGDDIIESGDGSDIVLGGIGSDVVRSGTDFRNDILLGDNGRVTFTPSGALVLVETFSPELGGDDLVYGSGGNDLILGGFGADEVHAGAGNDMVLGDNGFIQFTVTPGPLLSGGRASGNRLLAGNAAAALAPSFPDRFSPAAIRLVSVTSPTLGAGDRIDGEDGDDLLIGGTGGDVINGGAGNDRIFGDHGQVDFHLPANRNFSSIFTQPGDGGGEDLLHGNAGDDVILGGQGSDLIYGDAGDDDLIGGHNVAGGVDAGDRLDGGAGNDVILGDNGVIVRRGDSITLRAQVVSGTALFDARGNVLITNEPQAMPTGAAARTIRLINEAVAQGDDLIAGGAGDDMLFGQLGNDVLRGDGYIDPALVGVESLKRSIDNTTDGDDYIEGNGGADTIFGDLGQDDLIGGSSDFFGLGTVDQRADGSDTLFGGDGTDTVRNTPGDTSPNGAARDADTILGDNGRIVRIVGVNGVAGGFLKLNYDNTPGSTLRIIPRAVVTLDYTPGSVGANDQGAADLIHGEAGNDVIYGMTGDDVLYGEGQDDVVIGGAGDDWISGGTGDDALLGDDGWVMASRNGLAEPLYGIQPAQQQTITAATSATATINVAGRMNYAVQLIQPDLGGRDMIYGGLGNDFLHGGAGSDGLSGAEALPEFYATPALSGYRMFTPGVLHYDPLNPLAKIANHPLNFEAVDAAGRVVHDGEDALFGEAGDDWLVGGTDVDYLYGGVGNDMLNADDNLDTNGGANTTVETPAFTTADIAFGDLGQDTMIANTPLEKLFDLAGEFNGYLSLSSNYGSANAVSFAVAGPFLRLLMLSQGADPALVGFTPQGLSTSGRGVWQIGGGP